MNLIPTKFRKILSAVYLFLLHTSLLADAQATNRISRPLQITQPASGNRVQNLCGVTASFTPGTDSVFSLSTYIEFTNTSINAASIQWQINGAIYSTANIFGFNFQVGTTDLSLIAINGNCRDTFTVTICCTGIPPDDKLFFSGSIGMVNTVERSSAITNTADSGFVIGGVTNYLSNAPGYPNNVLLVKIKSGGCIKWSKVIRPEDAGSYATVHQLISLRDSGFLVSGYTGNKYYIMRLDKAGDPVWAKEYQSAGLFPSYRQLYEMNDGSLVVAGISQGAKGFSIIKMDAQGNVLWHKFLLEQLYDDDRIWPRGIYELNNAIYVLGNVKLPDTSITQPGPYTSFLIKLNPSDGQLSWSKIYLDDLRNGVAMRDLHFYDTSFVMAGLNYKKGAINTFRPTLHWIDSSGNVTRSIVVDQFPDQYPLTDEPLYVSAGPLPGGNTLLYFLAKDPSPPTFFTHHYFFKIDRDTTILSRQTNFGFSNDELISVAFNGRAFGWASTGFGSLIPWFQPSDNFSFMQRDSTAIDHGCSYQFDEFRVLPLPLEVLPISWTRDTLYQTTASPLHFESFDAYPQIRSSCPDYIDSCAILKVRGQISVCNLNDTYTYKAGKNNKCPQPVEWSYPGALNVINQTDSSITVKFNSFGSHKIIAFLRNGCNPVKDSIIITAASRSAPLNLGIDTSICTGNTLLLHASPNFLSYQWQDGSADSLLSVSSPGMYWVNVIDSCGNTIKDTINVSAGLTIALNAGPDRTKCNNDTLQLSAPPGFLSYSWSNSYNISSLTSQSVVINPVIDTAYYIKAEKTPGCFGFDTIRVAVYHSPPVNLGADTSFCNGDSLLLNAGNGFTQYLWTNNSSQQQIIVRNAGSYSVIATTTDGCKSFDTLRVLYIWPLPIVDIKGSNTICIGSATTLDAGAFSNPVMYQWSNGSHNRNIDVSNVGNYSVAVKDNNGCVGTDMIAVTSIVALPSGFLPADTFICSYETIQLKPLNNFKSYLWSSNASTPSIAVSTAGQYWLQVTDDNDCKGQDTIIVNPKDCPTGFYVPSAFTPNGDGKNDLIGPSVFGRVENYSFTIYNRWGQVIFHSKDPSKKWDGTVVSVKQNSNVFVWLCTYKLENEPSKTARGTIVLIR